VPWPRSAERRRRGLGWLWPLLALLAVALVAALALGLFDGDDDGGQPPVRDRARRAAGAAAARKRPARAPRRRDAGGSLTVGGTSILPPAAGGPRRLRRQDATPENVVVQSVVRNAEDNDRAEGFWVGSSEQDRRLRRVGRDGRLGRSRLHARGRRAGQPHRSVPPGPENPETALKLNAADAELVRTQGGFVNADEVSPVEG
jgi:hypothetical protein